MKAPNYADNLQNLFLSPNHGNSSMEVWQINPIGIAWLQAVYLNLKAITPSLFRIFHILEPLFDIRFRLVKW